MAVHLTGAQVFEIDGAAHSHPDYLQQEQEWVRVRNSAPGDNGQEQHDDLAKAYLERCYRDAFELTPEAQWLETQRVHYHLVYLGWHIGKSGVDTKFIIIIYNANDAMRFKLTFP